MKNFSILLIFYLFINFSFSQEEDTYNLDYNNSQKAVEICTELKGSSFMSNAEADEALSKILSVVGASKRFIVTPCEDINNAIALVDDGIRYIIYDPVFINSISNDSNYWSNMSILAHEVGHHINGHTLSFTISATENKIEELEADEFSGFVMAKLGATLDQATEAIAAISQSGDDTYSSHPSKERRIRAITKGYNNAINNRIITEEKLDDYEALFHRASEKSEMGDYEGAIEDYTESIKLKPLASSYFYRGNDKENIDDVAGALIDYRRAVEIDPSFQVAYYFLGRALYINSDYYGALSAFEKYSDLIDDFEANYYDLYSTYFAAISYKEKGYFERAIEGFDILFSETFDIEATADEEYIDQIYLQAGYLYEDVDSLDIALNYYKKAVELNQNSALNVEKVGDIYLKKEDYDTAIEYYEKALELNIDKASVYQYRAYAYEGKNDVFSAIFDMNEAIKLDPEYGFYYYERGRFKKILNQNDYCEDWALAYENGYDSRENLIEECGFVEEDFYSAEDFFNTANIYYDEGEYEKSLTYFEKARELGYDSNLIDAWLVYVYMYLGNFDLAEDILSRVVESDYDSEAWEQEASFQIAYNRGNYRLTIKRFSQYEEYMKMNPFSDDLDEGYIKEDYENIVDNYEKIIYAYAKIDDNSGRTKSSEKLIKISEISDYNWGKDAGHYYLAEAKMESGDYYAAMQQINESVKINPNDYQNLKLRADIKLKLGAIPSACSDLNLIKTLENLEQEQIDSIDKLILENCDK